MSGTLPEQQTRRTWQGKAILAGLLVLACAGAYWYGASKGEGLLAPNEGLVVDDADLWFGEAWDSPEFPWKLRLRNTTAEEVKILSFSSSCQCVALEPQSLTIPAGEEAPIKVTLNLAAAWQGDRAAATKEVAVPIIPLLEGKPPLLKGWELRGRVRRALTCSPSELTVSDTLIRGEPFPPQKIELTPHAAVADVKAVCPQQYASAWVREEPESRKYLVEFAINPQLGAGWFEFAVRVEARDQSGRAIGSYKVPVRVNVTEPVQLLPSDLVLGAHPLGSKVSETVVLHAHRDAPISVHAVEIPSRAITVQPTKDGSNAFQVTVCVDQTGTRSEQVTFVVSRVGSPATLRVPLSLAYHGLPSTAPATFGR